MLDSVDALPVLQALRDEIEADHDCLTYTSGRKLYHQRVLALNKAIQVIDNGLRERESKRPVTPLRVAAT